MKKQDLSQYEEGGLLGGMKPSRMNKQPTKGGAPLYRKKDAGVSGKKSMQRFK